jgi:hypothetical protein
LPGDSRKRARGGRNPHRSWRVRLNKQGSEGRSGRETAQVENRLPLMRFVGLKLGERASSPRRSCGTARNMAASARPRATDGRARSSCLSSAIEWRHHPQVPHVRSARRSGGPGSCATSAAIAAAFLIGILGLPARVARPCCITYPLGEIRASSGTRGQHRLGIEENQLCPYAFRLKRPEMSVQWASPAQMAERPFECH